MVRSSDGSREAIEPSKPTSTRLSEVRNQSLILSARPIPSSRTTPKCGQDIIDLLRVELGDAEVHYLEEPTISLSVDPTHRAKLHLKNGFKIKDTEYRLNVPFDWRKAEGTGRNAEYKLQSWQMIDAQIVAAATGNEEPHLQVAYDIALDWIDRFIFNETVQGFVWYDMAVGQRATKIAYLLQKALKDNMDEKIVLPLLIAADIHMIELMQKELISTHSNHGLFQMAGLLALSSSLPGMRHSERCTALARRFIFRMLDDHFTEDGLHKEHSSEYHIFMTNYISQLMEIGWLGDDAKLADLAERTLGATEWLVQPDGHILPLGDSKNIPASQRLRYTPLISKNTFRGFFQGGLGISRMLNDNGDVVEHLSLTAQFHSRQHKHADDLSIHFSSSGKQFLVDSGTQPYNYETKERTYVESTRAHNAIEIDGMNTSRFSRDTFGSKLDIVEPAGRIVVLSGKVNHRALNNPDTPYNEYKSSDRIGIKVAHRRIVVHDPQRFLLIVDLLSSAKSHEYIQWFHLHPELVAIIENEDSVCINDDTGEVIGEISPLTDSDEVILAHGEIEPRLQGWTSISGTQLVPSSAIGFRRRGESTTFATILTLGDSKVTVKRFKERANELEFLIESDGVDIEINISQPPSGLFTTIEYENQAHYIYPISGGH